MSDNLHYDEKKSMESEGVWYTPETFETLSPSMTQETSGTDGWESFKRAVMAFFLMLGVAILIFGGLALNIIF